MEPPYRQPVATGGLSCHILDITEHFLVCSDATSEMNPCSTLLTRSARWRACPQSASGCVIAEGFAADIAIVNPASVIDRSTFADPHQTPTGIPFVLVNGVAVIDEGRHTDARPGQVLRRGGVPECTCALGAHRVELPSMKGGTSTAGYFASNRITVLNPIPST